MGRVHETTATLGFYGDDLDPDEITAMLGGNPTGAVRKGEIDPQRANRQKIANTGSWRFESDWRTPGDVDAQILELLAPLADDLAVWRDLASRFRARMFCGLFLEDTNQGLAIQPATLIALGERGLVLDLDIYGATTDESE